MAATSSRDVRLLIARRSGGGGSRTPRAPPRGPGAGVDEDELRVGELPKKVRDAELAGRPDQEIRVRHLGCVEVRRDDVLVDLAGLDTRLDKLPRCLDDLSPAAVVEGDPEPEARVLGRLALETGHLPPELLGSAVAAADEVHLDALRARGPGTRARSSRRRSPSTCRSRRACATSSRWRRRTPPATRCRGRSTPRPPDGAPSFRRDARRRSEGRDASPSGRFRP